VRQAFGWATRQELTGVALPFGVTQDLYWSAAIFREANSVRIPKTQPKCLGGSKLAVGPASNPSVPPASRLLACRGVTSV
jgi:hypothetical protein